MIFLSHYWLKNNPIGAIINVKRYVQLWRLAANRFRNTRNTTYCHQWKEPRWSRVRQHKISSADVMDHQILFIYAKSFQYCPNMSGWLPLFTIQNTIKIKSCCLRMCVYMYILICMCKCLCVYVRTRVSARVYVHVCARCQFLFVFALSMYSVEKISHPIWYL